jgi:serine/threonine protein kinase
MSEEWQKVKELFHAALEHEPLKRTDFLVKACAGDEAIRREVESLIAAHEKPGSFVDAPAYELAADLFRDDRPGPLVGQQIGHYEVLGKLGAGGMGEVHLALDTQLNRKVAIKLLPAEFAANAERVRRFEQEARAASALNHPNIVTVYEIGKLDQQRYIVTEYIEGETLRQRMAREPRGRLRLSEALEMAAQVAGALQAAHEAGITHRDIKPENVMVRQYGLVKVLDFGLAKPSSAAADSQLSAMEKLSTRSGVVMGTVSYMSPEQARGEKVDHRTDIFALGVMVYEMLSGQRPFGGATVSDIIAARVHEPDGLRPMVFWWRRLRAMSRMRTQRCAPCLALMAISCWVYKCWPILTRRRKHLKRWDGRSVPAARGAAR